MKLIHCGSLFTGVAADGFLHEASVAVDGDRVAAVSQGWEPAAGREVVDLREFAVMPGLVDAHDHFGINMGDGSPAAGQDPQLRALKAAANARAMLASGITTLRNAGEKHNLGIHVRDAIDRGWIAGPRTVLSGVPICATGGHGWFLGMEVDGPDAVRRAVRQNVKAGADMIKMIITGGVTTPGVRVAAECTSAEEVEAAVKEAHALDRRIGVHCYGGPAATWAIDAGVDSIEHGTYLDDAQLDAMVERGTFLVATTSVMRAAARNERVVEFMRRRFGEIDDDYKQLLARARARGVRIATGCDTHHASMHEELATLLDAGFRVDEVLEIATLKGAQQCGREADVGSLEPGKLADFVAVDGDLERSPVEALQRVVRVFKGGRLQAPAAL
jgi:imidazolonepropionase-like amidohydrolase